MIDYKRIWYRLITLKKIPTHLCDEGCDDSPNASHATAGSEANRPHGGGVNLWRVDVSSLECPWYQRPGDKQEQCQHWPGIVRVKCFISIIVAKKKVHHGFKKCLYVHGILKLLHTTLLFINVKELRERANLKCLNYQQFTTIIRKNEQEFCQRMYPMAPIATKGQV